MDVPSPAAGIIEKLHVQKGSLVSAGSLIATIQGDAAKPAEAASHRPRLPLPPRRLHSVQHRLRLRRNRQARILAILCKSRRCRAGHCRP